MELRPLTANDVTQYRSLRLEALKNSPEAFSSDYQDNLDLPISEFESRITSPSNLVLGAFVQDSLVGTGGLHWEQGAKQAHKCTIWGMYVTPDQRGQGIGRKIVEQLIHLAKADQNTEQILISVESTNEPARSLYRSVGFETFGTEPRSLKVNGTYYDEDHMVQIIG